MRDGSRGLPRGGRAHMRSIIFTLAWAWQLSFYLTREAQRHRVLTHQNTKVSIKSRSIDDPHGCYEEILDNCKF